MTARAFMDLVHHVQYKPGWSLEAFLDSGMFYGCVRLVLRMRAQDAYAAAPHEVEVLMQEIATPDMIDSFDTERAIGYLCHVIRRMEDHETCEWFRVDGRRPFDPHRLQQ